MILIEGDSESEGPFTMVREKICEPIAVCGAPMCTKKQTPDGKDLQQCSRSVFSILFMKSLSMSNRGHLQMQDYRICE
jgi:hypothetical protein